MKSKILLAPSLLLTAAVNAQEAPAEVDFEFIIQGVHARDSQTALPITVLSEEEIRSEASVNIGDSLSMQPGINNASFGPAVGQPVIRGQQGRRVMSLTNGMVNADASGNSADHAVTVEPMLATGVEILRGPSTLLYGGGAIGGVVNVTDSRFNESGLDRPVFSFEWRHDSASDMDTAVGSFSIPAGNFVLHADITDRQWNDLEISGLAIHPDYLEEEHEEEVENFFGNTDIFKEQITVSPTEPEAFYIKGHLIDYETPYPLDLSEPNYDPDVPLYTKTPDSDIYYAAGWYCINFDKCWKHGHGPKYSTLIKYGFRGPFKTEEECKVVLKQINKERKNGRNK